jgi:hypothetical protein
LNNAVAAPKNSFSVSPYKGLFYFDSSFRPVPLEQHFIGVRGKPNSALSKKNLEYVTFKKVSDLVDAGHQVMIFVHARKETVRTAMQLKEMIIAEGELEKFSCEDHPQWSYFRRELAQSRNKEMKQLFDDGFGIHHAGMLRSDRNLMERMFEARAIKVSYYVPLSLLPILISDTGSLLHSYPGLGCELASSCRFVGNLRLLISPLIRFYSYHQGNSGV